MEGALPPTLGDARRDRWKCSRKADRARPSSGSPIRCSIKADVINTSIRCAQRAADRGNDPCQALAKLVLRYAAVRARSKKPRDTLPCRVTKACSLEAINPPSTLVVPIGSSSTRHPAATHLRTTVAQHHKERMLRRRSTLENSLLTLCEMMLPCPSSRCPTRTPSRGITRFLNSHRCSPYHATQRLKAFRNSFFEFHCTSATATGNGTSR